MKDITEQEDVVSPNGVLDTLSYVKAVLQEDLGENVVSDGFVERVYRGSDERCHPLRKLKRARMESNHRPTA